MAIIEIRVPAIAESVTEVTLSQWLKGDGDMVKLDEPICEFESDKATLELPAEVAGKIKHTVAEGSDLKIGDVIATIDTDAAGAAATSAAPKAETKAAEPTPSVAAPTTATYATGHPSPAAGKILTEANVAAASVQGTGKDGRITQADAQKAAAEAKTVVTTPVAAPITAPAAPKAETKPAAATPSVIVPSLAFSRNERRVKMSRMRQTIAKRLVSAKNTTAMLTTFNEVDMSAVMAFREKYQDRFVKKYGIKLGFMSLFAKACAKVLLDMPDVNASIDSATNEIIYHDYADISLAISTPTGLVVPPIRNVESLNFAQFESQLKGLAVKARDGKLTLEEMSGGTFTITNGGVFGSLMSTPIINEPQSAILGMHAIKDRAVVVDGQIVIRPMMYLALSYDHRVIDGSTSVTFLVKVKELIEDPTTLLLDI
ncbi:MAG: 2-oxoglutarate dehydrogenase complex dihydrolipoyllysine-residue succinyltransferase [Saprospiraceae bacterium]|nr:2-oxoglutarate dehydrogenase complex dihydrolipoyllysine-residue succinyltransferase [Saprospiraceae bacterium]